MKVGSLFSGCGGLDLGFELAGFETKWFSETDKWCNTILEKQWPEVPRYGDVRELENPEGVDILIGGFPCQPVSQAGQKRAEEDERWLWPGFLRTISLLQPNIIVVENVPGLRRRGFDRVLGDLAEGGYNAQWFSLRSSDIGAPHRRERVFIIANSIVGRKHEADENNQFIQFFSPEDTSSTDSNKKYVYRQLDKREIGRPESTVSTSSDASGERTGRFTGEILGEEEQNGRGKENQINPSDFDNEDASNSTGKRSQRQESERRYNLSTGSYEQNWGDYEEAIRRWESIFGVAPNPRTEEGRLSPYFVEWMMGFPEGWTEGVSRSQRLKMLGNSVQVQCAYEVATIVKSLAEFY